MTFGISLLLHVIVIGGLLIEHAADEREHLNPPSAAPEELEPITLPEHEVRLATTTPAEHDPLRHLPYAACRSGRC